MDYLPKREADLLSFMQNADSLISVNYATYGLEQSQAQHLTELVTAFAAARAKTEDGTTRSPTNIVLKDEAKKSAVQYVRAIVGQIQKSPATSDAEREALRINIRKTPQRAPLLTVAPGVDVLRVNGLTVTLRIHDDTVLKRAKPAGAKSAAVFSFVGAVPSSNPRDWAFEGNTKKTTFNVTLPDTVAGGSKVWFVAYWLNNLDESGPASEAVSTCVAGANGWGVERMRIAA
jgi:hypothetical protein